VGPEVVCWYGVGDIGGDGCGKTVLYWRILTTGQNMLF
jgi:hypothetical protein